MKTKEKTNLEQMPELHLLLSTQRATDVCEMAYQARQRGQEERGH